MHYVKGFKIHGIDTAQVACIELNGKPNAATEGSVGALGIDMTSPLHEVYKCVAVNGSIYTWELFSSGLSIVSSTMTGAGEPVAEFPYDKLRTPGTYVVKVGDLILDKEGYLYTVIALGALTCTAEYCGTQIVSGMPKVGEIDNGKILQVVDGCHKFVDVDESSVGEYIRSGAVKTITTINGKKVKFFVGTRELYDALSETDKQDLYAIITDDTTREEILASVAEMERRIAEHDLIAESAESIETTKRIGSNAIETLPVPFLVYDEETGTSQVHFREGFHYDPYSQRLTVPMVVGNLVGNVTGDVTGKAGMVHMTTKWVEIESSRAILTPGELKDSHTYVVNFNGSSGILVYYDSVECRGYMGKSYVKIRPDGANVNDAHSIIILSVDTDEPTGESGTLYFKQIGL